MGADRSLRSSTPSSCPPSVFLMVGYLVPALMTELKTLGFIPAAFLEHLLYAGTVIGTEIEMKMGPGPCSEGACRLQVDRPVCF